jgi:hypothetical protein
MVTVSALGCALALALITEQDHFTNAITPRMIAPAPKISAAERSLRPNYPYSIIPGGAYSPAELRLVTEKDPQIRDHYADFNVRNARLVVLTEDRYEYVSFKLHQRIFWTRNRLKIPKGEILLTDGSHYARTRCGNRLSVKPQANTTALQPAERLLSLPAFRPELLKEIPLAEAPPVGELAQLFPNLPLSLPPISQMLPTGTESTTPLPESWPPAPSYSPIIPAAPGMLPPSQTPAQTATNFPPTSPTPVTPVAPVPEPATAYLLLVSLCVTLGVLGRMAWRRNKAMERN